MHFCKSWTSIFFKNKKYLKGWLTSIMHFGRKLLFFFFFNAKPAPAITSSVFSFAGVRLLNLFWVFVSDLWVTFHHRSILRCSSHHESVNHSFPRGSLPQSTRVRNRKVPKIYSKNCSTSNTVSAYRSLVYRLFPFLFWYLGWVCLPSPNWDWFSIGVNQQS